MRKFVLIDPSISGVGGHYLEYAERVLKAAKRKGYATILGTNQVFPDAQLGDASIVVERAFRYDIWGVDLVNSIRDLTPPSPAERHALKCLLSHSSLLWHSLESDSGTLRYLTEVGLPKRSMSALMRLARIRPAVDASRKRRSAIQGASSASAQGPVKEFLDARRDISLALSAEHPPTISDWDPSMDGVARMLRVSEEALSFKERLGEIIHKHEVGGQDIVFMPTMSWSDFQGLVDYINAADPDQLPLMVPLFRRNIFDVYPNGYLEEGYRVHPYRVLLSRADENAARHLMITTDTEPLSEQYRTICSRPVATLPIPCPEVPARLRGLTEERPLVLTYLGDARAEKGFGVLPEIAVALMQEPLAGRMKINAQLYFPPRSSDAAMMRAGELLRLHSPHRAEILEGPLDSSQYAQQLENADALFVAYDHRNYAARSSGIFMEALVAGVPVITTAGTWMSGIIDMLTAEYHDRSITPREVIGEVRASELHWRAFHGGGADNPSPPDDQGEITVREGCTTYTELLAPSEATHLWLTCGATPASHGVHVGIVVSSRTLQGAVVSERRYGLGGSSSDRFSIVLQIEEDVRGFWIGLYNAFSALAVGRKDIRMRWLRRRSPIARCAAGLTTMPFQGTKNDELLKHTLPEFLRDYDEIARTAAEASRALAAEHSADALFAMLQAGSPNVRAATETRKTRVYKWV